MEPNLIDDANFLLRHQRLFARLLWAEQSLIDQLGTGRHLVGDAEWINGDLSVCVPDDKRSDIGQWIHIEELTDEERDTYLEEIPRKNLHHGTDGAIYILA